MLMGRHLRSQLDILHPDVLLESSVSKSGRRSPMTNMPMQAHSFTEGEMVFVKDFSEWTNLVAGSLFSRHKDLCHTT